MKQSPYWTKGSFWSHLIISGAAQNTGKPVDHEGQIPGLVLK